MSDPSTHASKTPLRVSIAEGREQLHAARFSPSGVSGGSSGELWFNRFGAPAFVSYFGKDTSCFSKDSLDNALAIENDPV